MLRQLANWNTAAGMLLFSQSLSGEVAVEKGLAWSCVARGELIPSAFSFTEAIQSLPKELLVRTKASLRAAGASNDHTQMVDLETSQQLWSIQQPFAQNAIEQMMASISSANKKT